MEQYINKSALVAEINQRIEDYKSHKIDDSYHDGLIFALEDLRDDFIDTLEVKEVDLEKAFFDWYHEEKNKDYNASILYGRYGMISKKLAKHFFELGLKAKGE